MESSSSDSSSDESNDNENDISSVSESSSDESDVGILDQTPLQKKDSIVPDFKVPTVPPYEGFPYTKPLMKRK